MIKCHGSGQLLSSGYLFFSICTFPPMAAAFPHYKINVPILPLSPPYSESTILFCILYINSYYRTLEFKIRLHQKWQLLRHLIMSIISRDNPYLIDVIIGSKEVYSRHLLLDTITCIQLIYNTWAFICHYWVNCFLSSFESPFLQQTFNFVI